MQRTTPTETHREYLVPTRDCAATGAWAYRPETHPEYIRAAVGYVDRTVYRTVERHPAGRIYKYGEHYGATFADESAMLGLPVRLGEIDAEGFHADGREGAISAVHQHRIPSHPFEDVFMVTLTETDEEVRALHFQFIAERLPALNAPATPRGA